MSGFIPMVSTTPPPIDDDDFGDFMDGTQQDDNDVDEFSSPVKYEDYSYPSLNSPPGFSNSVGFSSEGEESPTKVSRTFDNDEMQDNDKEVETILSKAKEEAENNPMNGVTDAKSSGNSLKPDEQLISNGIDEVSSPSSDAAPDSGSKDSDDWLDFADTLPECRTQDTAMHETPAMFNGSPEPEDVESYKETITDDSEQIESQNELDETSNQDSVAEAGIESALAEPRQKTLSADDSDNPENSSSQQEQNASLDKSDPGTINSAELPQADTQVQFDDLQSVTGHAEIRPDVMLSDDYCSERDASELSKSPNPESDSDFAELSEAKDDTKFSDPEPEAKLTENESTGSATKEDEPHDSESDFADFRSSSNIDTECLPQNEDVTEKGVVDDFSAFESKSAKETEDSGDFADFQTVANHNTDNIGNEEFGDFSSNKQSSGEVPENKSATDSPKAIEQPDTFECDFGAFESTTQDPGDDGFGDFSNAPPIKNSTNQSPKDTEFGDFSTTATGDDDEFADFNSGSASAWAEFPTTVIKKLTLEEKILRYASKYLASEDDGEKQSEKRIQHLDEHLSADDTLSKNADSPSVASVESMGIVWPGDLWDQLEDIDNAIALNFLWNGSGHNKHLLDSLGMHTQNILFSGAKQAYYVPTYYAAGLGLIDPNKGILKPMSAAEKITAMSPTDKNPPTAQDEIMHEEPHSEWKTIADEHGRSNGMAVDDSWLRIAQNTSNTDIEHNSPINHVPVVSSAMDLKFFDNLPVTGSISKPTGSSDLIDPELLELTSAPTTEPPPPPKDSGSATLSKILASIKGENSVTTMAGSQVNATQDNTKWEEEESKLTTEARSVLKRLPDLSYMRAKVLMFPMNMSRVNIGEDL